MSTWNFHIYCNLFPQHLSALLICLSMYQQHNILLIVTLKWVLFLVEKYLLLLIFKILLVLLFPTLSLKCPLLLSEDASSVTWVLKSFRNCLTISRNLSEREQLNNWFGYRETDNLTTSHYWVLTVYLSYPILHFHFSYDFSRIRDTK